MLGLTVHPFGLHGYHKGGDGGAGEIRRQEEERNRKIREATDRVNQMFDGRPAYKRGAGQQTTNFAPGQTYYDANGNPVVPKSGAGAPGGVHGYAANLVPRHSAPAPAPLYSGVEEVAASSGFNDDYFKNIADAYLAYQTPLVEEQAAVARRNLPMSFGSTSGSAYQREAANLERDYQREIANLRDKALDFSNEQRANVERSRADLIGMANAGTDADALAAQTASRVAALSKPPAYSPIADLFQKYAKQAANYAQADMMANQNALYYGTPRNAVRTVG